MQDAIGSIRSFYHSSGNRK